MIKKLNTRLSALFLLCFVMSMNAIAASNVTVNAAQTVMLHADEEQDITFNVNANETLTDLKLVANHAKIVDAHTNCVLDKAAPQSCQYTAVVKAQQSGSVNLKVITEGNNISMQQITLVVPSQNAAAMQATQVNDTSELSTRRTNLHNSFVSASHSAGSSAGQNTAGAFVTAGIGDGPTNSNPVNKRTGGNYDPTLQIVSPSNVNLPQGAKQTIAFQVNTEFRQTGNKFQVTSNFPAGGLINIDTATCETRTPPKGEAACSVRVTIDASKLDASNQYWIQLVGTTDPNAKPPRVNYSTPVMVAVAPAISYETGTPQLTDSSGNPVNNNMVTAGIWYKATYALTNIAGTDWQLNGITLNISEATKALVTEVADDNSSCTGRYVSNNESCQISIKIKFKAPANNNKGMSLNLPFSISYNLKNTVNVTQTTGLTSDMPPLVVYPQPSCGDVNGCLGIANVTQPAYSPTEHYSYVQYTLTNKYEFPITIPTIKAIDPNGFIQNQRDDVEQIPNCSKFINAPLEKDGQCVVIGGFKPGQSSAYDNTPILNVAIADSSANPVPIQTVSLSLTTIPLPENTWNAIGNLPAGVTAINDIKAFNLDQLKALVATNNGLYKFTGTMDGGMWQWEKINFAADDQQANNSNISAIAFDGNNKLYVYAGSNIYSTTDAFNISAQNNWALSATLSPAAVTGPAALVLGGDKNLYASTAQGIYAYADKDGKGMAWTKENSNDSAGSNLFTGAVIPDAYSGVMAGPIPQSDNTGPYFKATYVDSTWDNKGDMGPANISAAYTLYLNGDASEAENYLVLAGKNSKTGSEPAGLYCQIFSKLGYAWKQPSCGNNGINSPINQLIPYTDMTQPNVPIILAASDNGIFKGTVDVTKKDTLNDMMKWEAFSPVLNEKVKSIALGSVQGLSLVNANGQQDSSLTSTQVLFAINDSQLKVAYLLPAQTK